MANTYPPLKFIDGITDMFDFDEIFNEYLKKCKEELRVDITKEEFFDFLIGLQHFVMDPYDSKFSPIYADLMTDFGPRLLSILGYNPNSFSSDDFIRAMITEIKDQFFIHVITEEWVNSKTVYKPDKHFAESLIKMKNIDISEYMIDHIPNSIFYIDLSDIPDFLPAIGVFVKVSKKTEKIAGIERKILYITCYIITHDYCFHSWYMEGTIGDKDNTVHFNPNEIPDAPYQTMNQSIYNKPVISKSKLIAFAVGMVAYITSKEPDIIESETTKHTYKKRPEGQKPKNKFSEVQIMDVGFTYGNFVRNTLSKLKSEYKGGTHRSPIPHFRCAHWHLYRVGKGRKNIIYKWIEPTFVNGKSAQNIKVINIEDKNNS